MRVRPAGSDDVPLVAELEREVFGPEAWSLAATAEEVTGPARLALVLTDADGSVVGHAVARCLDEVLDLHRIAVSARHRRAGHGRRLLDELRLAGRARGADRILLEVSADNTGALRFYAAEGFVEISRRPRYYRDGSDAVVMRTPLDAARTGAAR